MKILKTGFSLAEILLTLGIVAVIATLGFTATKKSIDNAYNLYIYTGYKGLTDAIFNANYKGLRILDDLNNSGDFLDDIRSTLSADREENRIDAPNGVSYIFSQGEVEADPKYHTITFIVPSKKFVGNNATQESLSFELRYYYDPFNIILPVTGIDTNGSGINIFTRRDLLPFYIDNGRVGRRIDNVYQPKEYLSWQEAWCRVRNSIGLDVNNDGCAGIPPSNGILRVENPRKIF